MYQKANRRSDVSRILKAASFVALGSVVGACGSAPESVADEKPAPQEQPFSTALSGEPVHEDITAEGLAFLQPAIVNAIQAANVSVDTEFALVNANHFDDCNFVGGANVIRSFQEEAVASLDPSQPPGVGDAEALAAFGRWLHTTQDFYAHSNWVELGAQTLADDSLTEWPAWKGYETLTTTGFRLVDGNPPARTSVTRQEDAPYPQDVIVRVKQAKDQSPGVISGSVDYEPGDDCPASVRIAHADLNKDHSDTAGRTAQFVIAKRLAVAQTHHEWCRLTAMTRAAWGEAGVTRLMTWAADSSAAQCP